MEKPLTTFVVRGCTAQREERIKFGALVLGYYTYFRWTLVLRSLLSDKHFLF